MRHCLAHSGIFGPWRWVLVWGICLTGILAARADIMPMNPNFTPEAVDLPTQSANVEEAIRLFQTGDRAGALEALKAAYADDPELPPPNVMLARLLLFSSNLAEARPLLEQAATEFPKYPGTAALFGNIALHEGRLADAEAQYEKSLHLADGQELTAAQQKRYRARAYAGIASVAELRGNWDAARTALVHWLEVDPRSSQGRHRLGRALFQLGEHDEAIAKLRQAAKEDPKLEPAEVTVGQIALDQREIEKAGEWFRAAVKRLPEDTRARLALAGWHLQQNDLDAAEEQAQAVVKMDAKNSRAKFLLGMIGRRAGKLDVAEEYFEAILQETPADFTASNQLVLALIEQESSAKHRRALQIAEMNVRQYPRLTDAAATLGWVKLQLGRTAEAAQNLQAAIRNGAAKPDTAYYLARLNFIRGDMAEAKRLLKDALAAPPGQFLHAKEAQEWWDAQFSDADTGSEPAESNPNN